MFFLLSFNPGTIFISDLQWSSGAVLCDQHGVDGVHAGAIEPDQVVMLQVLDGLQLNQHVPVEADLVQVDPLDGHPGAPVQLMSAINQTWHRITCTQRWWHIYPDGTRSLQRTHCTPHWTCSFAKYCQNLKNIQTDKYNAPPCCYSDHDLLGVYFPGHFADFCLLLSTEMLRSLVSTIIQFIQQQGPQGRQACLNLF